MALHCCMIVWKNNKKPKKLFYQGKVPPFKIIYIYFWKKKSCYRIPDRYIYGLWSWWYLDCNSWLNPVCLRHAVNLFYFMWLLLRTKYSFNMITQTIWIDMYSKIELYVCLMQIFRLHDSNDIINSCWHSSHQNLYRYVVQRQRIITSTAADKLYMYCNSTAECRRRNFLYIWS